MKEIFSIEEILGAVNDLQEKKKDRKIEEKEFKIMKKYNNDIPKDTLRLIEEAEKTKN